MKKLLSSLTKARTLAILILIGFVLLFIERWGYLNFVKAPSEFLFVPVELALYRTYQNVSAATGAFLSVGQLHQRNSTLEMENAQLRAENSKIASLEEENKTLREQLGSPKTDLKIKVVASVIGFGVGGSRNSLLIDKGSDNKLKQGDLVVIKNIFVGVVNSLSPRTSRVQLIVDPDTKIPAVSQSGALGVLVGQFGTEAHLTNVVQDDKLTVGDLVVTSGEADFPKGLVLGRISSVTKVSRELFQDATVTSLVDLGKIETVFVLDNTLNK